MPKLSDLASSQYEVVSVPEPLKLSQMQADSYEVVSLPEKPGLIDRVASGVESAGTAVIEHPLVSGPLHFIGDKLERYVDAPVRAQIGSLQDGASFTESIKAGGRQLGKDPLPTTPSGKDIMARTGLSKVPLSEAFPGLFTPTGVGIALKKGGLLDVSAAGVAGGLTQPSTFAIPAEAVLAGGAKAASLGGKAARVVGETLAPTAEALKGVAAAGRRGVFKVGEVMTRGNLKATDAIAAADKLSGPQLILPDAYIKGAGKKVGAARDVIESAGESTARSDFEAAKAAGDAAGSHGGLSVDDAMKANPKSLIAPEAADKLARVREIIVAGEEKAAKTPGSAALLDRLDRALAHPGGVPVEAVDDMIRDLNGVEYTEKGNPRSIEPRWAKPLAQARGELETLLKTTPEGAALSEAKEPFRALKTAQGKQRSGLATIASWTAGIPAAAAATALGSPIAGALAIITSRAIAPRTYFQIVGASKMPAWAVDTLKSAYESGKASAIGKALAEVGEKYPQEITKITAAISAEGARSETTMKQQAMKRRANGENP